MASERAMKRVLDLLTKAPRARIESLPGGAPAHARSMRRIISTDNVVAVGIAEKVSRGQPMGKLALTFYVQRKVALKKLKASAMIPPTVPEALSGPEAIPTDVVVLGKLRPEVNAIRAPIQPGNSICHFDDTAGTLGALVTKGKRVYLLSNSHVLALSGRGKKKDDILYPGPADGGKRPADRIAELAAFKPFVTGGSFVNRVDCAIAKPVPARQDLVSEIKGLGTPPKGTATVRRGMTVVKVGRTTGKTTGTVRDVNFRFVLDYGPGVGEVGFLDQVLCTRYTKPGDSGSLVLAEGSGRAVGLHFAGANGGSVFCPIGPVLSALGVKLVTTSLGRKQAARSAARRRPRRASSARGRRPGGRKRAR
jgi:hypothetical protein